MSKKFYDFDSLEDCRRFLKDVESRGTVIAFDCDCCTIDTLSDKDLVDTAYQVMQALRDQGAITVEPTSSKNEALH